MSLFTLVHSTCVKSLLTLVQSGVKSGLLFWLILKQKKECCFSSILFDLFIKNESGNMAISEHI